TLYEKARSWRTTMRVSQVLRNLRYVNVITVVVRLLI
ncbi:hypothetical protein LCGC14_2392850, partial [marine sediment metagenome]